MTWSDSEKERESDNDVESKNFTTFMIFAVEVIETSSKASEIEKLDESDGIVRSFEEESNKKDKSELQ